MPELMSTVNPGRPHRHHQRISRTAWWALELALVVVCFLGLTRNTAAEESEVREPLGINNPIHEYYQIPTQDRFGRLMDEIDSGRVTFDASNELDLLRDVLRALEIPVTSQMLVTSATSLQKTIISPRRPRALYFNDDTYVGFVPGGQIEVISMDPKRGGMFYLFERVRAGRTPRIRRSENCLTCHATPQMNEIPQLVIESVVPGITGGGEKAFRRNQTGHAIPLDQRFGGWLVTGAPNFTQHWGNILIEQNTKGVGLKQRTMKPGELFDPNRYLLPTSDLLPQLLHEHQVGFHNRVTRATYQARTLLHGQSEPSDSEETQNQLQAIAKELVRYILFADEAPLPPGGVPHSEAFEADFLAQAHKAPDGKSLRDLDLKTRLMRYRCSYLVESDEFASLPKPIRRLVDLELERALDPSRDPEDYAYLPNDEKEAIRSFLKLAFPTTNDKAR